MNSPESQNVPRKRWEVRAADFIWAEDIENLKEGLTPTEQRHYIQIRLAIIFFEYKSGIKISKDDFINNKELRDKVMEPWGEDSGCEHETYSAIYSDLERSEWFKNHPDLKGDIFKIKLSHFLEFLELKKQGLAI